MEKSKAQMIADRRAGNRLTPSQMKYIDELEEKRKSVQDKLDPILKEIYKLKASSRNQSLTLEEKLELEKLAVQRENLSKEIDYIYSLMKGGEK